MSKKNVTSIKLYIKYISIITDHKNHLFHKKEDYLYFNTFWYYLIIFFFIKFNKQKKSSMGLFFCLQIKTFKLNDNKIF